MTDLWSEASRDIEAEQRARLLAEARAETSDVWAFLAGATSREDFTNRLALSDDSIDASLGQIEAQAIRGELVEGWRSDWSRIASVRQREAARKGAAAKSAGRRKAASDTPFEKRPSYEVYIHEHPYAAVLKDEGASEHGWGYTMGQVDIAAGLPAMSASELPIGDYAEGYLDAYADHQRFGSRSARKTARFDDIVAYTYKADLYTPEGVIEALIRDGKASPAARDMNPDDAINQILEANGFDPNDLYQWDSDDFPKLVFRTDLELQPGEGLNDGFDNYVTASRKTAANWNDNPSIGKAEDGVSDLRPGMPGVCPNCHSTNVIISGHPSGGPANPTGRPMPSTSDCKSCGTRWIRYPNEPGAYDIIGNINASRKTASFTRHEGKPSDLREGDRVIWDYRDHGGKEEAGPPISSVTPERDGVYINTVNGGRTFLPGHQSISFVRPDNPESSEAWSTSTNVFVSSRRQRTSRGGRRRPFVREGAAGPFGGSPAARGGRGSDPGHGGNTNYFGYIPGTNEAVSWYYDDGGDYGEAIASIFPSDQDINPDKPDLWTLDPAPRTLAEATPLIEQAARDLWPDNPRLAKSGSARTASGDDVDGWMCWDCGIYAANADTSGMDPETEARVLAAFDRWADKGYTIVNGSEDQEFSWSPCDVCGSNLGGGRMEVVFLDHPGSSFVREGAVRSLSREGVANYGHGMETTLHPAGTECSQCGATDRETRSWPGAGPTCFRCARIGLLVDPYQMGAVDVGEEAAYEEWARATLREWTDHT